MKMWRVWTVFLVVFLCPCSSAQNDQKKQIVNSEKGNKELSNLNTLDSLQKYISQNGGNFGGKHLLCNCTQGGCDMELVRNYGSAYKGLCMTDGLCIKMMEKDEHTDIVVTSYNCIYANQMQPEHAPIPFVCLEHVDYTHVRRYLCCNESLCNGMDKQLKLTAPPTKTPPVPPIPLAWKLAVCVSVPMCIALFVVVGYMMYRYRLICPPVGPSEKSGNWAIDGTNNGSAIPLIAGLDDTKRVIKDLCVVGEDFTTGSGIGAPILQPRTISNQIALKETIGQGRYGEVIRGVWRGDQVAVKVFASRDETAYYREVDVYLTTMMRHPNILHFVAADTKDTGEVTQLWLVTEYHKNGSLLDYLSVNTVTMSKSCRMVRTLADGLAFLHAEIEGTHSKPAIAHRDVKSKNVLVRDDGSLCIADLGLAVRYRSGTLDLPSDNKVGTVRYLAPEVLDESMPMTFDGFRAADIYSLGLIIWEIARRTDFDGEVDPYELPYYDQVSGNPKIEEMKRIVVDEGKRPVIPTRFQRHHVLQEVSRCMSECWAANPNVRNQAMVVRNTIDRLGANEHLLL